MKKPRLIIDVLTLFPKLIETPLNESMLRQAQLRGAVQINIHNLRDFAKDKHRTCDQKPYGGGAGMVMMVQPIFDCLSTFKGKAWRVLVSPRGKIFNYAEAKRLSRKKRLVFICGHYEGVDERVHKHLVDEELSIGDFVATGGELPALCMIDAVIRLVPGVLGNKQSLDHESFTHGMMDFPHYTRPRIFNGWKVPDVLCSGDHKEINAWRAKQALAVTKKARPDLLRQSKN